jgi:hypothetical protein
MLTKKRNHTLQLLYFDWRILENYNLFIDDIEIPIDSIHEISLIREHFSKLKADLLSNLEDEDDDERNKKNHCTME